MPWVSLGVPRLYLVRAAFDVLGGEVWQLLEVRVLGPHGLSDHLGQFHGSQRRAEPPIAGQHVHTGLDQPDGLDRTGTWSVMVSHSDRDSQGQGWTGTEPAIAGQDIHTGLDQPDGLTGLYSGQ